MNTMNLILGLIHGGLAYLNYRASNRILTGVCGTFCILGLVISIIGFAK